MAVRRKARNEKFGEWLDVTLSNKNVQGRTLAEAAGVADSAVSRWRSGQAVPPMEAMQPIADLLSVDALRLSVTAGLVPGEVAGVEPLPMPEPTARRESVRRQLARLRGVTETERRLLMQAYEDAKENEA